MLNDILKSLRTKKGISQVELSKELGISKDLYNKYEKTNIRPQYEVLIKIADFYNVSTDYLLERAVTPPDEAMVLIPILASIQAGYGKNTQEEYTNEKMEIPKFMIHGNPIDYFILQVQGDSMYPTFKEGEYILMERTNFVDSGQTAAVCIGDEEATLKRVIYDEAKTFISLEPANNQYPTKKFVGEEMNQIRIVGAVKWALRSVY